MSDQVIVVSAAIVDRAARCVLLAQRASTTSYPLKWCTPGGKRERGESDLEALVRELREELRVEVVGEIRKQILYEREIPSTRTGKNVLVRCYVIPIETIVGTPQCGDKTIGVGWFGVDMIGILPMALADGAERDRFIELLFGG